jgi:hypothetical protein
MLIKSKKRADGAIIFRKGIGYFMKLLQAMNENGTDETVKKFLFNPGSEMPSVSREIIILCLRIFTDIKNPVRLTRLKMVEAIGLMIDCVKFNSPPAILKSEPSSSRQKSVDELAAGIVDILASEYGWTVDYIMEQVDLYEFCQLRDAINERKSNEMTIGAIIAHDPKQTLEIANKMKGVEVIQTWGDL